jgi:hypothetical protein
MAIRTPGVSDLIRPLRVKRRTCNSIFQSLACALRHVRRLLVCPTYSCCLGEELVTTPLLLRIAPLKTAKTGNTPDCCCYIGRPEEWFESVYGACVECNCDLSLSKMVVATRRGGFTFYVSRLILYFIIKVLRVILGPGLVLYGWC